MPLGVRRGLVALEPVDGPGPDRTLGPGLARADLGLIETVPRGSPSYGRILDGLPGGDGEIAEPDLLAEAGLGPRHARRPRGAAAVRAAGGGRTERD